VTYRPTADHDELRAVGISRQKASYLHSLAEHSANGALNDRALARASDDDDRVER